MSDPFLGEIRLMAFDFPPAGWALCNGQSLPINQNAALYSLLGTQFGGDAKTVFNLPDLRGRVPVHTSGAYHQGAPGGAEQVTLTISTMPTHTHGLIASNENANRNGVGQQANRYLANTVAGTAYTSPGAGQTALDSDAITSSGGQQAHPNMQPYLVVSFAIALTGYYPMRP